MANDAYNIASCGQGIPFVENFPTENTKSVGIYENW